MTHFVSSWTDSGTLVSACFNRASSRCDYPARPISLWLCASAPGQVRANISPREGHSREGNPGSQIISPMLCASLPEGLEEEILA